MKKSLWVFCLSFVSALIFWQGVSASEAIQVTPHIENDAIYLPLRFIAEKFSGAVEWNEYEYTVTVKINNRTVTFSIDNPKIAIDSKTVALDNAPFLKDMRTMIPIRGVSEGMGLSVIWNKNNEVTVTNDTTGYADVGDAKIAVGGVYSESYALGEVLAEDYFETTGNWVVETDGEDQTVVEFNGKLDAKSPKGITAWYKNPFEGDVLIEYEMTFVTNEEGERLSDMNCFWKANDPENPDDFFANSQSRGAFASYNPMTLYYVGYGGNDNSTTRFRKYNAARGDITGEYLTQPYLIEHGKTYKVSVATFGNNVQYYRDGELLFTYYDEEPLYEGYFGIRTVTSHIQVSNFKAYNLVRKEENR